MAALGSQSIKDSYPQLLHTDNAGGGNSTTLVNIKDGDNGTTFALQMATDKIQVNGNATITTADNTTQLSLISTDADANVGPALELYRNSASPADSDLLGTIYFYGEDGADNKEEYARIESVAGAKGGGAEEGVLNFYTNNAGTLTNNRLAITGSETVINESSGNFDFRVESNNDANMLFVYACNDKIGISNISPQSKIHIDSTTAVPQLIIDQSTQQQVAGIRLRTNRGDTGSVDDNWDMYTSGGGDLRFAYKQEDNATYSNINVGFSNPVTFTSAGLVGIGTVSPSYPLTISKTESAASDFQTNLDIKRNWSLGDATDRLHGLIFSDLNSINAGIFVNRYNSAGNYESHLNFYANSGSSNMTPSASLGNPKMTIDSSGNTIIGTHNSNAHRLAIESRHATVPYGQLVAGSSDQNQAVGFQFTVRNSSGDEIDKMFLTDTGLGIGTTAESALHLNTSSSGGIGGKLIIDNQASDADGNGTEISFFNAAGASASGVSSSRIRSVASGNTNGYSQLQFWTYHASEGQRMTITSDGNVGIGVSSSISAKLDVNGSAIVGRTRDIGSYASDDFDLMVTNGSNNATVLALYNDAGSFHTGLVQYYNNSLSIGLNNSNSDDSLLTSTAIVLDANTRISLGNNDSSGQTTNTIFGRLAGNAVASGANGNTLIGNEAGNDLTSGVRSVIIGETAGATATTSSNMVLVGAFAGDAIDNTLADGTVAIGRDALTTLTSGGGNTALGFEALKTVAGGNNNTVLGHEAGENLTQSGNTLLGFNAGKLIVSSSRTVLIGAYAGDAINASDSSADGTVGIGYGSLGALTTGGNNIGIGIFAGNKITDGTDNTLIGRQSGYQGTYGLTTGDHNTALGSSSFGASAGANITGNYNTAIGSNSMLEAEGTASSNTAVGYQTLLNLTDGDSNTAIGNQAMGLGAVTGDNNVAIGAGAGYDITSGHSNVIVGKDAGVNITSGIKNTVVGHSALATATVTAGQDEHVAIGHEALKDCTGDRNTAVGTNAMSAVANSDNCVAVGYEALKSSGTTDSNIDASTAIGYKALTALTTGGNNTAVGKDALLSLTSGDHNCSFGIGALATEELGQNSIAIGSTALYTQEAGSETGMNNIGIGRNALYNNVTGAKNIAIGTSVGATGTNNFVNGNNNVFIGDSTTGSKAAPTNQIVIGEGVTGNQDYGTVIGNVGMFQFASKQYTAHQSDGEDLKSASGGEGIKLPAYSIIKSISVVVTQLSNLGTFDICLVLADESVGIGDNTAFTNPVEVLGARVAATLSGNSASAVNIALGSGAILKQSYHMDEAINVGATDKFLHLAQAGTGNGDTNPTTNALLNIMVEYIGLD